MTVKEKNSSMLYFAYGSNMSHRRLLKRVPAAVRLGPGILTHHRLVFHKISHRDGSGKCDIETSVDPDNCVHGVVFEIQESEKAILDRVEGLGYGYESKTVSVRVTDGRTVEALTYYATSIDKELKPYHWYKHHVITGARENLLPVDYIKLIDSFESIPDPDEKRTSDEMAIYRRQGTQ